MRRLTLTVSVVLVALSAVAQQTIDPRQRPGAQVHLFAPEPHDLYDGHFVISASRVYMVGSLNDPEGWDHLDNDAKNVRPVPGTAATQGLRDRTILRLSYPLANKAKPGGETNPATQQIDFYIRSPQQNPKNRPNRQVFSHFFGMEVTWK